MAPKRQRFTSRTGSLLGPRVVPLKRESFLGPDEKARYHSLDQRKVWLERFVRILDDRSYRKCARLFADRHWEKLREPEPKLHLEIIREFYVNVLLTADGKHFAFKTWVWG